MSDVSRLISVYHVMFIVFAVLAVLFFLISIILFFKFDIRRIWAIKSGRAVKRSIKEMEKETAKSGKLRENKPFLPRERSKKLEMPPTDLPIPPELTTGPIEQVVSTPSQEMQEGANATGILKDDQPVEIGTFTIEKKVMLVHTEEVV